jgi:hypothetical protein
MVLITRCFAFSFPRSLENSYVPWDEKKFCRLGVSITVLPQLQCDTLPIASSRLRPRRGGSTLGCYEFPSFSVTYIHHMQLVYTPNDVVII